jgi:hypothetical protein
MMAVMTIVIKIALMPNKVCGLVPSLEMVIGYSGVTTIPMNAVTN